MVFHGWQIGLQGWTCTCGSQRESNGSLSGLGRNNMVDREDHIQRSMAGHADLGRSDMLGRPDLEYINMAGRVVLGWSFNMDWKTD